MSVKGEKVKVNFFDMSGRDAFADVREDFFPETQGLILTYASAVHHVCRFRNALYRVSCFPVQSRAVLCSYIFMSSCAFLCSSSIRRGLDAYSIRCVASKAIQSFYNDTDCCASHSSDHIHLCVCVCVCVSICTRIHIAHHGRCTGPTGCDIERLVRSSGRLACWCVAQHRARCNCTLTHSL